MPVSWILQDPDLFSVRCQIEDLIVNALAMVILRIPHHAHNVIRLQLEVNLVDPRREDHFLLGLGLVTRILVLNTSALS